MTNFSKKQFIAAAMFAVLAVAVTDLTYPDSGVNGYFNSKRREQ